MAHAELRVGHPWTREHEDVKSSLGSACCVVGKSKLRGEACFEYRPTSLVHLHPFFFQDSGRISELDAIMEKQKRKVDALTG